MKTIYGFDTFKFSEEIKQDHATGLTHWRATVQII